METINIYMKNVNEMLRERVVCRHCIINCKGAEIPLHKHIRKLRIIEKRLSMIGEENCSSPLVKQRPLLYYSLEK